ncbi:MULTISPECIES: hypothetical protein [unclassified Pseudodesulfovibrio]|uniref:hypothetical protein n=1 Tax=unclassified Pseudodesulfovibrio TaxID=2661612 RepID=UPI000FEBEBB7|nr:MULTISPECIES: hypothetical protein [unclassified Pseudodesulfovibrio]MCJ2165815.1 hypothetical protein [Pseudodesulfovibrio sp. S3-i]RWU02754.1 hypothetical protein DWB63_14545 [Pseudodesulfovibrio sp. S3]
MRSNISQIEESILRMTAVVRAKQAALTAKSFGEEPDPTLRPRGWWVMACGEPLDEDSFDSREQSRQLLLVAIRRAGLNLPENIWVWDEAGVAQLVISTVPSIQRANTLAQRLREKGLTIRIKRETF